MRFLFVLAIALAFKPDIPVITPEQLEKQRNDVDSTIVMFYAPWCGHCKRFLPVFQRVANSFKQFPEIKFARINCKEYPDTCRKNYVFGYPSLSFFLKKKPGYPYDGPKDAPRIVGTIASFVGVKTMVAPPVELVVPMTNEQFTQSLSNSDETTVVLLWRQEDDNTYGVEIIQRLANAYLVEPSVVFNYLLYNPNDLPVSLKGIRIEHFPTIVVVSRGEIFLYEYQTEEMNMVDDDDDEEEVEEIEEEEKKLIDSGVLDLINDITGASLSMTGSRVQLPGHVESMSKLLNKVDRYDRETLDTIADTIKAIEDERTKSLYQDAYDRLMKNGSAGVWKEWRQLFDAARKEEDEEAREKLNERKNILRLFAKDFDVNYFENDEL
ncbi:hypothetical protein WA538_002555 [Blastocystis sp. DL]